MQRDLPIHDPLLAQAMAAEAALMQAQDARRQGELALALAHALVAHARAPLPGLKAAAGMLAGFCQFRLGQHAALLELGQGLLPLVGDPLHHLELLRWLTVAAAETGHHGLALRVGGEALALADHVNDEPGTPTTVRQAVALAFERMGDPWRAELLLLDTLAEAETLPQRYPLLATLLQLSQATLDQHHLMPHRAPARRMTDPAERAAAAEAEAAAGGDTLHRAAAYARRAQAVATQAGDTHYHGRLDGLLGEAWLHQGRVDEAWPLLTSALCLAQGLGHGADTARLECGLGEALLRRRDWAAAQQRLQPLLAPPDDGASPLPTTLLQRVHRGLARAGLAQHNTERAARHLAEAERLASAQARACPPRASAPH